MNRIPGSRSAMVAALVTVAFALRIVGLQYGLPDVYNPDEVAIMARALSFAKGTLNPGNFLYPTFYFYVLFGWVGTYLGGVWLTGGVSSLAQLQQLYFTDPTGIYTAGRLLGAVCGALSVLAVFQLGRRLFDWQVGLAAALFLAVAPLAVRDAHYVKHDVPVTLAIVVACIAIVRIWPEKAHPENAVRDVAIGAAGCGVAFSTHYYSIFLALPLAWSVFQRMKHEGWPAVVRYTAVAALVSAGVFFALSPFILTEPGVAWRDITANRAIVIDRAVEAGAFRPAGRYLEILWNDSMGTAVVALGLAGAACMAVTFPARAALLLLFPIPFFLFITNTTPASRYLNPILPFLAIFAAWMIRYVAETMRAPRSAVWVVVAACAVPPVIDSVRSGLFFRTDDTRTLARRFVEQTIPDGASVLIQPYSVPLSPSRANLIEAFTQHLGSPEAASTKFQIQLGLEPYPDPSYRIVWLGRGGLDVDKIYIDPVELDRNPIATLRQRRVTYVILKRYNNLDPELEPLISELSREARLIASFTPYRPDVSEVERAAIEPFLHNTDTRIDKALERPGPPLEIWQLDGPDS